MLPPSNKKAVDEIVKSYRLMFELLIKAELFDHLIDQMARARVWGSHIKLQAAASLFQMPVFLYTTSQSEHQQYKRMCYKPLSPE